MLRGRGWVSGACDNLFVFIVIGLLVWPGISSPKADELIEDEVIQQVLGNDPCPLDSKVEGPPQAIGLNGETDRDLFRVKRIAGGDLRGEFCLIESLRFAAAPSQSGLVLYRRDNGPWRKVEEGYAMEVLETRTNGYPDISLPYWPPGKPRAARVWRAHAWDGHNYKPKFGPPSSLSGLSRYDGYNGVVSDGADAFFVVGATETGRQGESVGFLRLVRAALDIDFGAAPPNVTSSAYVDVIRLSDGDVVIVGWQRAVGALADDCAVMRASPEGQVRWRQVLGGASHERCYFISELPSGEIFVGGRTEPSTSGKDTASGAVWRLNARTGSPAPSGAATIRAAGVNRSAFQDAAVFADGSIIFVGWATAPDRSDDDIWLVKQDPAGRFVWERRIGEEGADLATSVMINADGDALVVGYRTKKGAASTSGLVMTVSTDGKPGWMREFDVGPAGNDKIFHSALLPDGSLMAVGAASTDAKAPFVGWMVHLDQAGKLLKEWLIGEPPGGRLNGVARLRGGGVVAVGSARDVARSDVDGWIVELEEPPSQAPSTASSGTLKPLAAADGGERSSAPDTAALQAALDDLAADLRKKIDHDIETAADAFWAVHEIERARRLADIFGVPLTALNLAISSLAQITNAKDIVNQFPKVAAGSWLSAGAYVAGLGAIEDASGNLRWTLNGPAYVGKIKQMYEQASKTGSEQEFKNVIKQSLHASAWIKAPPASIERGIPAMSYGTKLLLASVGQSVAALKEKLAAPDEAPDSEALKRAVAALREVHTKLIASRAGTVQVPLPGADRGQTSVELALGSIAQLLKVHAAALGRYDAELKQRQIEVAVDAGKSVGRTVLLGVSFGSGDAVTTVQSTVLAVDSLAWTGAKQVFQTDVRSLIAEVPQQMVFSLSNEFSNAWQLTEAALAEVQRILREQKSPSGTLAAGAAGLQQQNNNAKELAADHPSVNSGQDASNSFDGAWLGTGRQVDGLEWPIQIDISQPNKQYRVSYVSLKCGGRLDLLKANKEQLMFKTTLVYGQYGCADGVQIVVTMSGPDQITFKSYLQNGVLSSTGELHRVNDADARLKWNEDARNKNTSSYAYIINTLARSIFFSVERCNERRCPNCVENSVKGHVGADVDIEQLEQWEFARHALLVGINYAKQHCAYHHDNIGVCLYSMELNSQEAHFNDRGCHVWGLFDASNEIKTLNYNNTIKTIRDKIRAKKIKLEQQQSEERKRIDSLALFFQTHRIEEIVDVGKLVTNPFPYLGKVVSTFAMARRMISQTDALFSQKNDFVLYSNPFIVTGIPAERFVADRQIYVVGRVLGLKVPSAAIEGGLPIAHLEYMGDFSGYSQDEIQAALAQARQ